MTPDYLSTSVNSPRSLRITAINMNRKVAPLRRLAMSSHDCDERLRLLAEARGIEEEAIRLWNESVSLEDDWR